MKLSKQHFSQFYIEHRNVGRCFEISKSFQILDGEGIKVRANWKNNPYFLFLGYNFLKWDRIAIKCLKIDWRRDKPKFWSKIYHFLMLITKEFPVFGPFSLIFPAIFPWKLGHSPNTIYIFGVLVRKAISPASFVILAQIIFDDFWFIRNLTEAERKKLKHFSHCFRTQKTKMVQIFFWASTNKYFDNIFMSFLRKICFTTFKRIFL